MDVAALTMVHTETSFLKIWVKHYEKIVGRENLYIITHGGDPDIAAIAEGCRLIYFPRRNVSFRFDSIRFGLINSYATVLFNSGYECVIGCDVDELVFADPKVWPDGLLALIEKDKEKNALTTIGLNVWEVEGDAPFDIEKSVFSQRKTVSISSNYNKPLVALRKPAWTTGFHETKHEPVLPSGLYMAHLKAVSSHIICGEVAPSRSQASVDNDLHKSRFRHIRKFWSETERAFRDGQAQIEAETATPLDDAVPKILKELRSNRVENAAKRGGISFRFKTNDLRVHTVPDRFGNIV